eukprot:CAMPEP_0178964096 /NCGR_PEP_ID=MMETSP0789-20121207/15444_1 /TAXON_ID=3005 /ORGANISM="Rhizosolenia setigera, Strain CCMP 1694" /LENGTH=250 /DNA_ID=CAMNT_0020648747 /DNA_START=318 /DNA_END=1070 /DNA_ORIENTATION=-
MKTVHVDGDYTQKMQLDTQDTVQRLAKDVAPRFSKDFLDFYTSFHRCAIKSPDFKFPSSNRTILGVDLPFNKVKFGTTLDLGAFIGGTNYVGITADFRKVDFSNVSLTDLDFSGVDLKGIEFEGFGNLCSGFKLGVGSKFSFSAGMTTTNVTSQEEFPETPLEIFQVLFRGKRGFRNFCTSLDIGGGLGVGSFLCSMSLRKYISDEWQDTEHHFEIGATTGPSFGFLLSFNRCRLFVNSTDKNPFDYISS